MSSKIIASNFSKSVEFYDESAEFQRHAAEKLACMIERSCGDAGQPLKVLEIGCGTGFLTEKLVKIFPGAEFMVTDISKAMVDACRGKMGNVAGKNSPMNFAICDFEADFPRGKYDIVVSGLTFQWLSDMRKVIGKIHSHLRPGGRLFFTTLAAPTFDSLRKCFDDAGLRYPGPALLSVDEIRAACSVFPNTVVESETYLEEHGSTIDFLRRLRNTGAVNPTGESVPPHKLRRIIEHHDVRSGNRITVKYHLVSVACKR